jgi:hypothetical protein
MNTSEAALRKLIARLNDEQFITVNVGVLRELLAARATSEPPPDPQSANGVSGFYDLKRLPQQEVVMNDWTNHHNHVEHSDECHLCVERKFGPEVAKAMMRFWRRKAEIDSLRGQAAASGKGSEQ